MGNAAFNYYEYMVKEMQNAHSIPCHAGIKAAFRRIATTLLSSFVYLSKSASLSLQGVNPSPTPFSPHGICLFFPLSPRLLFFYYCYNCFVGLSVYLCLQLL